MRWNIYIRGLFFSVLFFRLCVFNVFHRYGNECRRWCVWMFDSCSNRHPRNIQQRDADRVKTSQCRQCALHAQNYFTSSSMMISRALARSSRRRKKSENIPFYNSLRVREKFLCADFKHDLLKYWENKWGDTLIYCSKFTLSTYMNPSRKKNVWCLQKYKLNGSRN